VKSVQAQSHNGRVQVTGAGGEQIRVKAHKRAGGEDEADAREAMAALKVDCRVEGDRLVLGWAWEGTREVDWGAEVSFDAEVPAGLDVHAGTHNGGVVVTGCGARCVVETHNGGVKVSGAIRELEVETHNGGVEVETKVEGPVGGRITTHNGGVEVALGKAAARVTCGTHNGRIVAEGIWSDASSERGSFRGERGSGGGALQITTHNGGVLVR
jgi:hypothetical protein